MSKRRHCSFELTSGMHKNCPSTAKMAEFPLQNACFRIVFSNKVLLFCGVGRILPSSSRARARAASCSHHSVRSPQKFLRAGEMLSEPRQVTIDRALNEMDGQLCQIVLEHNILYLRSFSIGPSTDLQ